MISMAVTTNFFSAYKYLASENKDSQHSVFHNCLQSCQTLKQKSCR